MSERNDIPQLIIGILLVLVLNSFAVIILMSLLSTLNVPIFSPIYTLVTYAMFGIGISQLLYVIPLVIRFKQQRKWGLMKGVIIGAVLTALLTGGYWLLLINQLR